MSTRNARHPLQRDPANETSPAMAGMAVSAGSLLPKPFGPAPWGGVRNEACSRVHAAMMLDVCTVLKPEPQHFAELHCRSAQPGEALHAAGAACAGPHRSRQPLRTHHARAPACLEGHLRRPLMHTRARKRLQDVPTAVRLGKTVDTCGFALHPNGPQYLRGRTAWRATRTTSRRARISLRATARRRRRR